MLSSGESLASVADPRSHEAHPPVVSASAASFCSAAWLASQKPSDIIFDNLQQQCSEPASLMLTTEPPTPAPPPDSPRLPGSSSSTANLDMSAYADGISRRGVNFKPTSTLPPAASARLTFDARSNLQWKDSDASTSGNAAHMARTATGVSLDSVAAEAALYFAQTEAQLLDDLADSETETRTRDPTPRTCMDLHPSHFWPRLRTMFNSMWQVIRSAPLLTVVVPLLVLLVFVAAGEVGVWAAANSYRLDRETRTENTAINTAQQLDFLLQSFVNPVLALSQLVAQTPRVPDLLSNADVWMASTMRKLDPDNNTQQLIMAPWNVKTASFPLSPARIASLLPANGADYNLSPQFSGTVVWAAGQPNDYLDLVGPLPPSAANCPLPGFCARAVIWLPSSNPNETWGNEVAFTPAWAQGPNGTAIRLGNATRHPQYRTEACGTNCSNYRNRPLTDGSGRQLVYWGFINHCVCISSITNVLDQLSAPPGDRAVAFKFVLTRLVDSTLGDPGLRFGNLSISNIVHESDTPAPRATEVKNSCRIVGEKTNGMQLTWQLCIAPVDGYDPDWQLGLQIMVVLVSCIVAFLVFLLMLSQENHRLLVDRMLPARVVRRLRLGQTYAEPFRNVTILFSDIVSYTNLSSELSPNDLVVLLDQLYSGFDDLVDKYKLYKVETIGDAFMCVGGAPESCHPRDAALRVANMALDMIKFTEGFETQCKRQIKIRIGIYTGPVTAAVMGRKMPHWCLVGDTVNVSSRMESNSKPMRIHVGSTTAQLLQHFPELLLEPRGIVDIKGKGPMRTFWLDRRSEADVGPGSGSLSCRGAAASRLSSATRVV